MDPAVSMLNENNADFDGRRKHQNIKHCRVCGDRALGYNFNVVTCESCKAFFRRNAVKSKEFRCPFEDNCDVSIVSRRFCQKCRLRKCFEVGMKKDWILSDEARTLKRRKGASRKKHASFHQSAGASEDSVESARNCNVERSTSSEIISPCGSTAINPADCHMPLSESGENLLLPKKDLINFLLTSVSPSSDKNSSKKCVCTCTCGATPSGTLLFAVKEEKSNGENLNENCGVKLSKSSFDSIVATFDASTFLLSADCDGGENFVANCQQFSPSVPENFDYTTHLVNVAIDQAFNFSSLTNPQKARLNELILANEVMNEPMEKFVTEHQKDSSNLTDFVNLMDIAIRRIIKMAKRIEAFKNLCQEDQIALLKGGCIELMVLRGVMSFDPVKDSWHGPKAHYIKVEAVRDLKDGIYEQYKNYYNSFDASLRKNEPVMLILCAITLFVPSRSNVLHGELLASEQKAYFGLLRSYLGSIYDKDRSNLAYEHLCRNIDDLRQLTEKVVTIFSHVNLQEMRPLLVEIFDLK